MKEHKDLIEYLEKLLAKTECVYEIDGFSEQCKVYRFFIESVELVYSLGEESKNFYLDIHLDSTNVFRLVMGRYHYYCLELFTFIYNNLEVIEDKLKIKFYVHKEYIGFLIDYDAEVK